MPTGVVANPACPRCDYDLRGQIDAWHDNCPLTGTCPECGLTFAWPDVLLESRQNLPWLIEHARSRPRGFAATFIRVLRPSRFWQRVKLHHAVVPRRLMLWIALLIAPGYLIASLARTASLIWAGKAAAPWGMPRSASTDDFWNAWLWPIASHSVGWRPSGGLYKFVQYLGEWPAPVVGLLAAQLAIPLLVLVLPETRRRAKLRVAHIGRAAAYSLWWLLPLLFAYAATDIVNLIDNLSSTAPTTVGMGAWPRRIRVAPLLASQVGISVLGTVLIWTVIYWRNVMALHWRIERADAVWLLLLLTALLAGILAVALHDPHFILQFL